MQVFLLLSLIIVILLININLIESKKNDIKEIKYKNKNDLKKKLEKETKNRILADEDEISPSQKKKLESEELNLKRDVMRSELNYGVDSIEKATSLHKLGRNMYQQGKYHDLKELSKEIVRIHEVVDGTDHVNVANALGNVGSLSFRIGDTRECEVSMQRALYILIEEHGKKINHIFSLLFYFINLF